MYTHNKLNIRYSMDYVWRKIKDIIETDRTQSGGTVSFTVKIGESELDFSLFKNLSSTLLKNNEITSVYQEYYLKVVKEYQNTSSETVDGDVIFSASIFMRYRYNVHYSMDEPQNRSILSNHVKLGNMYNYGEPILIKRDGNLLYKYTVMKELMDYFKHTMYYVMDNEDPMKIMNIIKIEFAANNEELSEPSEYVSFDPPKPEPAKKKSSTRKKSSTSKTTTSKSEAVTEEKPKETVEEEKPKRKSTRTKKTSAKDTAKSSEAVTDNKEEVKEIKPKKSTSSRKVKIKSKSNGEIIDEIDLG